MSLVVSKILNYVQLFKLRFCQLCCDEATGLEMPNCSILMELRQRPSFLMLKKNLCNNVIQTGIYS